MQKYRKPKNLKERIKIAYLDYKAPKKVEWSNMLEAGLALAAQYDEGTLRSAVVLSACYARYMKDAPPEQKQPQGPNPPYSGGSPRAA